MSIASARSVEIQTKWTPQQMAGDQSFSARKFDEALTHYREAVNKEERLWARHALLAKMVWCYRSQGEIEPACNLFLKIPH